MAPKATPIGERLMRKIATDEQTGCWNYTGAIRRNGYGSIGSVGKTFLAHRVEDEYHRGPIPEGLHLDHLCRNRACVNPYHLEPVPVRVNVVDRSIGITAFNARKTHCRHGHAFDDVNTYVCPGGKRRCRTCRVAERAQRSAAA